MLAFSSLTIFSAISSGLLPTYPPYIILYERWSCLNSEKPDPSQNSSNNLKRSITEFGVCDQRLASSKHFRYTNTTNPHAYPIPLQNSPTLQNPTPQPHLPTSRLINSQMQEWRAQGLCYNCDE
ncbi:hypothetical protein Lal_00036678 [Lupinus albus]|nr:hypothetical protein Lal_00036678 [Lupinus albus]